MAQPAMNITTDADGKTKDELAVSYGNVIESVQKASLSEKVKNKNYSGDPTTGSVKIDRFKNSETKAYGTARTNGKGDGLANTGKVTVNIDQDKEIVEEFENKDVKLFGIPNLVARRESNHAMRMTATLDSAFFAAVESAATAVTDITDTNIEDVVEAMIQKVESVKNDFVDGVPRDMIVLTMTPAVYGKMRNHLDKVTIPTADAGQEVIDLFHGVRIYSNVRQTSAILAQTTETTAQPVTVDEYQSEHIPLSNAVAAALFYSFGTKVVCPDLAFKLAALPTPAATPSTQSTK